MQLPGTKKLISELDNFELDLALLMTLENHRFACSVTNTDEVAAKLPAGDNKTTYFPIYSRNTGWAMLKEDEGQVFTVKPSLSARFITSRVFNESLVQGARKVTVLTKKSANGVYLQHVTIKDSQGQGEGVDRGCPIKAMSRALLTHHLNSETIELPKISSL